MSHHTLFNLVQLSKFNKAVERIALLLLLALVAPVRAAWTALFLISKRVTIPSIWCSRSSGRIIIHADRRRLRKGEAAIIAWSLLAAQIRQVDETTRVHVRWLRLRSRLEGAERAR